ncbi:MAG TPA: hypothetical protein VJK05_04770 [archaeon]|nr:hypothetical protein [archaeon]
MSFTVFLSKSAEKGLARADQKIKLRLGLAIDELESNSVPSSRFDVAKIKGSK